MRDLKADKEFYKTGEHPDWLDWLWDAYPEAVTRAIAAEELVRELQKEIDKFPQKHESMQCELACLREENDQQRTAIQELSCQVAGLREGLEQIKFVIEEYHPHNTLKLPRFSFAKGLHDIACDLLSQPDPGEKYRNVIESVMSKRELVCEPCKSKPRGEYDEPLNCHVCVLGSVMQALSALKEGD